MSPPEISHPATKGDAMEHHTDHAPDAGAARQGRGQWLWISAGVMAALVVVQGAGLLDRPAMAEMTASAGGYTMMTTDGGSNEVGMVIDERNETLLVYSVKNRREVRLENRQSLPELFTRARAQAGHPPRP